MVCCRGNRRYWNSWIVLRAKAKELAASHLGHTALVLLDAVERCGLVYFADRLAELVHTGAIDLDVGHTTGGQSPPNAPLRLLTVRGVGLIGNWCRAGFLGQAVSGLFDPEEKIFVNPFTVGRLSLKSSSTTGD